MTTLCAPSMTVAAGTGFALAQAVHLPVMPPPLTLLLQRATAAAPAQRAGDWAPR